MSRGREVPVLRISIVIPAFNEEKLLPGSLTSVRAALAEWGGDGEIIVVDNRSTDGTAEVARLGGARVVEESVRNIGRVRNAGAAAANGDVLVFLDADTRVPPELLTRIAETMNDPGCSGGAVAVDYDRFERWWMRFYSMGWSFWGKVFNMKGGAAQFCRRAVFEKLGGYDEKLFLGEDVEFYWRMSKLGGKEGGRLAFITQPRVTTSTRRFDKMSAWKALVLTNPIYIVFNAKRAKAWKDWYENAVR